MICIILADFCILTCNHASKKLQGPLKWLKLIFSTSVGAQLGVLTILTKSTSWCGTVCVPGNLHCAHRWPWIIAIVASSLLKVVSTGTINHIQGVLWTDESRCCLDFNDGRGCVWSKKNERFRHRGRQTRDLKPSEHDLFCGVSDLVWHKLRWFHRPLCHKERISYRCPLNEWDHCTYCKTRSWRH